MKLLSVALVALAAAACTQAPVTPTPVTPTPLAYQVDAQRSSLSFVTVKAGQPGAAGISEVSRFERFAGTVNPSGRLNLEVDVSSVSTGVGIRDDRLRTLLFNVGAHPKASFTAQVDAPKLAALAEGMSLDVDVNGEFTLAGQTRPMTAKLRVARLAQGALQVSTLAPIIVDASQFGLKPGVDALREIMNLNFIAAASPVSFTMVLHAQR